VVAKLFRTAQKYQLTLQPQLILLQKTLLNTEGLARTLDPDLDLWAVAQPVLEDILRERYSPKAFITKLQQHWPEFAHQAADLPALLQSFLSQHVEGQSQVRMRSDEIAELVKVSHRSQRQLFGMVLGFTAALSATLLMVSSGHSAIVWLLALVAISAFIIAWPKKL
jgi:ubiquinone biosynthesis protein